MDLTTTTSTSLQTLSADARAVARAMALFWTWRARAPVYELLRHMGVKSQHGRDFSHEDLRDAQKELRRTGLLVDHPARQGYSQLQDAVRIGVYREVVESTSLPVLREALHSGEPYDGQPPYARRPLWDMAAAVALLRLELYGGSKASKLAEMKMWISHSHDWATVVRIACFEAFDPLLFERTVPEWRWDLAYTAASALCLGWQADLLPACEWALAKLDTERADMPGHLRLQLGEILLHRGQAARINEALAGDEGGMADALRAGVMVQQGRWPEAQAVFESALKKRHGETRARKRLLPETLAWLYPLVLLAQQTPRHLELAKKFCLGEAGLREPVVADLWGVWVHAISVRQGDAMLNKVALVLNSSPDRYLDRADLWRIMLRTWLGADTVGKAGAGRSYVPRDQAITALRERLQACRFDWLAGQLSAAETVFSGGVAPPNFFVAGAVEKWRTVLTSLQALSPETTVSGEPKSGRVLWAIHLNRQGTIETIEPLEQKRGPRGWGKPKPIPLARLAVNDKLEAWDAKVVRAIRRDRYNARHYSLDRAAAIAALIGHPTVTFAGAPETMVDVVEGAPELEVVREGDQYSIRVTPQARADAGDDDDAFAFAVDEEEARARAALRAITVVRDSPQRLRVIRLTPAQRRATQLLAGRFAVPASAQAELQQTLQSLAGHFQIHSDHAEGAREVEAESRLRAELAPSGQALTLRLVVAPLGPDGPRLMPGNGRARVMAALAGESVGTQRDLPAERANLDAVLAAFDFLDPPARGDVSCEWLVEEPDRALDMVELLPQLPAVHAVDWPRGKPVRVITVGAAGMTLKVRTERDWFKLQGEARLDEGLVFKLEALLAAAASGSRFMPMGQGVYAALTRELRDKLAEIAAVAEPDGGGLRVPQLAAAWLDDVLEGVTADRDPAFMEKVERLRAAQEVLPVLPGGLQTELRPYQEDGYAWASRLAEAGFGACLADDMGLGKTIQTLALLLARAAGGPSLVVAPTSVCGNWLAETQRFAPTLNPMIFGEGDRAEMIEAAGPRDVIIASYTLMQQAQEAFGSKTWHTLVADEAQAVKNATAKRSVALFELPADFRIALSGTPIENRLAELWSIMRFCNPGLLGTLTRFNERFAAPIERNRDRDAQRMLRRLIAPFVLRRTKSEVLQDLPPRTELVLTITPEPAEAAHYEALRRTAVAVAETAAASEQGGQAHLHVLAQLTRLRRAACDPRLVSPQLGIVGAKVRAFADLALELVANGHKALVFSQFVDFLSILRAPLDEAGIHYQYLDGSTPAEERTRRVAAFQGGEGDLFLISLKAGGYGLNLTAADYVVITDPWWNPAAEDQAMGRAHRIGQLRPVTVYRLVGKGTLEERIVELHHDKRALADGVLAESGESAVLPSTEELIALIRGG